MRPDETHAPDSQLTDPARNESDVVDCRIDLAPGQENGGRTSSSSAVTVGALFVMLLRRWLAIVNVAMGIFVGLPVAAPLLLAAGFAGPARAIYETYHSFCHQLPHHSFFLFGTQAVYSQAELETMPGVISSAFLPGNDFFGNAVLGYKLGFCERDLALYGTILLAGLTFGVLRHRVNELDWRLFAICALPIAVDGFTQLFGLRESTWQLRILTGVIFGGACVWFAYPFLDRSFGELADALASRLEASRGQERAASEIGARG